MYVDIFLFTDRDINFGHSPRGQHPDVEWEPYFCVLNQLDQTFTAYRSEEMSVSYHFYLVSSIVKIIDNCITEQNLI